MQGDLAGERRRYGVPDLAGDVDLGSLEDERVREALEPGGFSVSDWPVVLGV